MKRALVTFLCGVLLTGAAVGCGDDETGTPNHDNDGEDAPRLQIDDSIQLSGQVGDDTETTVTAENTGDAELTAEFEPHEQWLQIDPASVSLDPDDSLDVTFTASCEEEGEHHSEVGIISNDDTADGTTLAVDLECTEDAPDQTEMIVDVEGLPDGADADILIVGPGDFDAQVTETTTFDDVELGEYTITASAVEHDDIEFSPVQPEQTVQLEEQGSSYSFTVEYEEGDPAPGNVDVTIDGLDSSADPTVELLDDSGSVVDDIQGEGTFEDVEPGDYTVSGDDYDDNGAEFTADDEDVTVTSDDTSDVTLEYEVIDGELEVVVDGLDITGQNEADADVSIEGDGVTEHVSSAGTTSFDLPPGTYDIVVEDAYEGPATFEGSDDTADVDSNDTTTVNVDYQVINGELDVDYSGLPSGGDFEAHIDGPELTDTITTATTFDDVLPGDYNVEFESYSTGEIIYDPDPDEADFVVESGETTDAHTQYSERPGQLEVNAIIPDDVELQLAIEEGGSQVDTFTVDQVGLQTFDLDPGTYQIVEDGTNTDEWDNEFNIDGTDEDFDIASGQTHTQTISTELPTLVTTEVDDADEYGSLREVVDRVNAESEITFDSGVETIELDDTIDIEKPLSLLGDSDPEDLVITQSDDSNDRLLNIDFDADDGDEVLIQQLSLEDAQAITGAGIRISGDVDLTLFDVQFRNNEATSVSGGGGLYIINPDEGMNVHIQNSLFEDNTASGTSAGGGAIRVHTTDHELSLEIADTDFINNDAGDHAGAIRLHALIDAQMHGITFESNFVTGDDGDEEGGALRASGETTLELSDVVFDDNSNGGEGGALWAGDGTDLQMSDVQFDDNEADAGGGAAAIHGDFHADQITASGNDAAGNGGAFLLTHEGLLVESHFYNNSANLGGAIRIEELDFPDRVDIENVLFEDNSSSFSAGALFVHEAHASVTNSTFTGNTSNYAGGAVFWGSNSGGYFDFNSVINNNCNTCASGGNGYYLHSGASNGRLKGNYFADNNGDGYDVESGGDPIESRNFNVLDDMPLAYDTDFDADDDDIVHANPQYSSLDGDGGFKNVFAIDEGSDGYRHIPAEDCWSIGSMPIPLVYRDQRGQPRPSGDSCTPGAAEAETYYETFDDAGLSDSFDTGSFTGIDGRIWDYQNARNEGDYGVGGRSGVWLEAEGDYVSSEDIDGLDGDVESMTIVYGIGGDVDDGDRQIRVLGDGSPIAISDDFSLFPGVITIDDFNNYDEIKIENNAPDITAGVVIDQVTWR